MSVLRHATATDEHSTDLSCADTQPSIECCLTISRARHAAASIIQSHDDRVLVIVGPCLTHSPEQAIEYAKLLKSQLHI